MSTETANANSLGSIISEISRLIAKHEPEKMDKVDAVLYKWQGRETEVLKILCQEYNEECPNMQSMQVKHMYSIQTETDSKKELRCTLLNTLLDHTELTKDICNEIISYLPLQTQFIKLHTVIQNASKHQIMQFVLIMVNNIVHYIICVLSMDILNIMVPFIIFSVCETILLLYFFNAFYRYISEEIATQDEIITLNKKFWITIQSIIDIPLMIIVLCSGQTVQITLYFVSYFITLFYRSFVYHFTYYNAKGSFEVSPLNPIWWLFTTLFVVIVYTVQMKMQLVPFVGVMTGIFHSLLCCYVFVKKKHSSLSDFLNLILICATNTCFVVFSVQLTNITFIIFGIIGAISILFIYIAGDYISETFDFKFSVLCLMELFVEIPITILLLYYMYSNDNEFMGLFYAIIGLYVFNLAYKACLIVWDLLDDDGNDETSICIVWTIFFGTKLMIAAIFSFVYINDVQDSQGLWAISIVFMALSTCIFVPILFFCCCQCYFISLEIGQNGLLFGL